MHTLHFPGLELTYIHYTPILQLMHYQSSPVMDLPNI
jgi:hypothetical protein